MIKPSVSETKWPGPALLFFIFRFEYLIWGPKSYRDFRETGPALSYKHIGKRTKDFEVRRDLGNRASPVNRDHVK